jgi:MFS family permease
VAIGLTRNVYVWFPLRFILGAVVIQLYVISETWIIALAPPRFRGRIMGIYTSIIAIGFGGGPLVLLAVGSEGSAPFLVGIVAFALCTLCLVAVRDRLPDFEGGERASVRSFLPHAQVLLFSVVASGAFEQSMLSLLPVYAFAHGINEATAAGLLTAMIFGNIALQVPLGFACERYTPRRMLIVCAAATALGCALLPFAVTTPLVWPLMFVWGAIAYGLYTVALVELGTRFSGSMLVAGNSAFAMMWGIGGLTGPPGTGLVMDWIGVQGLPLTLGLMCVALLAAAAIRAASRRRAAARTGAP